MQPSVPSPSQVQATFAATLFDEWIALGLRDVVVCPGSRSTPLALACVERAELAVHVRIDERSAGFFALGRALVTERPVAIVVTSGTAAAELHACVAEASQAFVPVMVLTADRPPELHGVGAPQTIDQHKLYGSMVRQFEDPGVAQYKDVSTWRDLATRLWRNATNEAGKSGPVHLNAAFIEPLIATPFELPERVPPHVAPIERVSGLAGLDAMKVLCVAGHGVTSEMVRSCESMNWVVLGDATALGTLPYFDALLRDEAFAATARPDVVVRLGGLLASRVLQERLRSWGLRTIGFEGAGFVSDPDRIVGEHLAGVPNPEVEPKADGEYVRLWSEASASVAAGLHAVKDGEGEFNEITLARTVVAASAERGVALVIGSSMPIRDVEWWAPARVAPTYANRGVNGIDGVVSTTLGVASGSKAIGLIGDITMLHDVSGLVDGLGAAGGTCALVVADNQGGGIFSFLPQASLVNAERFELLFGTPRHHDLATVAQAFGHESVTVGDVDSLRAALDVALSKTGLTVIVARLPSRERNVSVHEEWNQIVRDILESTQ
ncbi:MAG TPA: 2-succinyl-5-enolpyruvyl-6-hydroxy-3-cyclohexene-1-carboxylic-acid synthase [Acidimicrobiales bacterium]